MRRVLVTDGSERAALAIVRSLGRRGYSVEVAHTETSSLAGSSRYAAAEHVVPQALESPCAFAEAILSLCATRSIDLLIPVTDPSLSALLPVRDRLTGTRLPFPAEASYRRASDKRQLLDRATALGIRVPRTMVLDECPRNLDGLDLPPAPWVCKPFGSVVGEGRTRRRVGVRHAASSSDLLKALGEYPEEAFPVLVQEFVEGQGEGVFLLLWEGQRIASFSHRRLREKPPTGGVSVYRESRCPDPELVDLATTLLNSDPWNGVAMVEFRRSPTDGTPYLMEVNGRFWGSLQLAIDAGVDFPWLMAGLAFRDRVEPDPPWKEGIRSRWLLGDLDHLLIRMKRSYSASELPTGSPSNRALALLHFLRPWWPGDRFEVLRASDPAPWLHELRLWVWEAVS